MWVLGGWGLFLLVVTVWFLGPVTYASEERAARRALRRSERRSARRAGRKGEGG